MVSTTGGSRRSGSASISQRQRRLQRERGQRAAQPALEPDRVQPARELAQLAAGDARLLARGVRRRTACCGVGLELAQREVERLAEHDEPLLGAVVQVAADPAALLVGGVDGAGARGHDLVAALAQRALVAAALELRGGAGGEHVQRLELARRRVERARGDHAQVADRAAVGAVQRDRQVAVELVGAQEPVGGVARPSAAGDEQQVLVVGVLAGRARRARTRGPRAAPSPRDRRWRSSRRTRAAARSARRRRRPRRPARPRPRPRDGAGRPRRRRPRCRRRDG